jgi:hypothetical protein
VWLERCQFLLGPLRPLEDRRVDWFTDANLVRYFEVARDVLINAGVSKFNPDYDPDEPFSQEIIITAPERLCSFDETKMELDCTKAGKGNTNRTIKAGVNDDNTVIVTKCDKCGSAICGRLGDGRARVYCLQFRRLFRTSLGPSHCF